MEQHSTRPSFRASFTLIGRRNITNVPVVLTGLGYNCGYFNIYNVDSSAICVIATIKIQCDHSNYTVLSAWLMSSSQFLTLIQDFFLAL